MIEESKVLLFIGIYHFFFWSFHNSEKEIQIIISVYSLAIPVMTMHRDKRLDSRSTQCNRSMEKPLAFPSEL